jgi:hypothetical protein
MLPKIPPPQQPHPFALFSPIFFRHDSTAAVARIAAIEFDRGRGLRLLPGRPPHGSPELCRHQLLLSGTCVGCGCLGRCGHIRTAPIDERFRWLFDIFAASPTTALFELSRVLATPLHRVFSDAFERLPRRLRRRLARNPLVVRKRVKTEREKGGLAASGPEVGQRFWSREPYPSRTIPRVHLEAAECTAADPEDHAHRDLSRRLRVREHQGLRCTISGTGSNLQIDTRASALTSAHDLDLCQLAQVSADTGASGAQKRLDELLLLRLEGTGKAGSVVLCHRPFPPPSDPKKTGPHRARGLSAVNTTGESLIS